MPNESESERLITEETEEYDERMIFRATGTRAKHPRDHG